MRARCHDGRSARSTLRHHGLRAHRGAAGLPGDRARVRGGRDDAARPRMGRGRDLSGRDAAQGGGARLRRHLCARRTSAARRCRRLDATIIFEELAQGCTSTAAYISIHNMAAWMIDALRRRGAAPALPAEALHHGALRELLPDRAGLRLRCGEPHDPRGARRRPLRARRRKGVHLGRRRLGHLRRAWCAPASDGPKGISCLVVEKGTPGLSFGAQEKKLGWKSQPTAMVMFEDCRVPVANRIGEEGQGFRIAMAGLDGGRLNIAACSIGGAQFCLDRTVAYMRERKQFGTRLADFQALAFRVADYATELEAARLMVRRAATAVTERRARRDARSPPWPSASRPMPASRSSTAACSCTAATATCAITRSSACCATCACTRSSKAPTR